MTATFAPERYHAFRPRRVRFDYKQTPTHWIPGDPHTTHVVNVLHLLLPAGERWFCEVFRRALPLIDDPTLQRDVKAFIGQEATHARAHDAVVEHLVAGGVDPTPFTHLVEWGFNTIGVEDAPGWLPGPVRRWLSRTYLRWQLAIIAAIEHFTAVLGWWIVVSRGLDRAGADPTMMQLLRWHGAEEVEHRSVAFDTYRAAGGGFLRRCAAMIGVFLGMLAVWFVATWYLMRKDPAVRRGRRASVRRFVRAGKAGLLPTTGDLARAVPRYLAPRYHPSHECRTQVAIDLLAPTTT
ncbi:MAG: metal-dependent hydrolase [Acidimicrobiales bacterium]